MRKLTKIALFVLLVLFSVVVLSACFFDFTDRIDEWEETFISPPAPMQIGERVTAISTRLFLMEDGSLWSWGSPRFRDDTRESLIVPGRIMEDVVAVSAGTFHGMAITSDGVLWAWGDNRHGQLGDGTTMPRRDNPVRIMEDVVFVAAGGSHTAAITSDGTLWTWGMNSFGQLGDGTMEDRYSPVSIMDNVIYIYAEWSYSMAITADGSVWAWGKNSGGQLGTGTSYGEREQPQTRGEVWTVWLSPIKVMEYVDV